MPIDPTDVATINRRTCEWAAAAETIHPVAIERVNLAEDAIDSLVEEVRSRAAGGSVLLLQDTTPMRRAGDALKPMLADRLRHACQPRVLALDDDRCDAWLAGGQPAPETAPAAAPRPFHASLPVAQRLAAALTEFSAIVSIGSGSITDTAKYARHLHVEQTGHHLPLICFPTAASVTAYTSALAVLTVGGVKRTLPARAPDCVVCDLRTLAAAPLAMTRAGFGDVLARSVSGGDWWLAAQIGMDDGFSDAPIRLLENAENRMLSYSAGVAASDPAAIRAVIEALLLAGMAMSIVNQTAPLSGWEHVISHFLDLTAAANGRKTALHGAQVGVGTLVSARAYENALEHLDARMLAGDAHASDDPGIVRRALARYEFPEPLLAEIERDLAIKADRWRAARPRRREFIERWRAGEIIAALRDRTRPSAFIADALRRAGAPCSFDALDPPIPPETAADALTYAHLIRARFTLGDLLSAGAWLTEPNIRSIM